MEIIHNLTTDGSLKIYQDTELNSFSFDSVLLANFVKLNKRDDKIVDLCTGNAPVAMLLKHIYKEKTLEIKAIEIQKEVAELAIKSVKENNLEDQIEVIEADLKGINDKIGSNKYNVVTCNPPYFKLDETSNVNPNEKVSIARHEILVNIEDIIIESKKLLDNMGVLVLVFRPDRLDELIIKLDKHKFKVKRLQFVYPKKGQKCNTILVEAKKASNNSHLHILEPLYVYDENGEYTNDVKSLIM